MAKTAEITGMDTMPPGRVQAFMDRMGIKHKNKLAEALGYNRETVGRWLSGDGEVPLAARLAMSALAHGLPPMD